MKILIILITTLLIGCDPLPQYCLDHPDDEACMLTGIKV